MEATIILALAILTAALVAGVFVMTLIEFNEIDEIAGASRRREGHSLLEQAPAGAVETG